MTDVRYYVDIEVKVHHRLKATTDAQRCERAHLENVVKRAVWNYMQQPEHKKALDDYLKLMLVLEDIDKKVTCI